MSQMTGDTYVRQLERSSQRPEADLEYYAVAAIGEAEVIKPFTRKLS